jgi:hypothetical protein
MRKKALSALLLAGFALAGASCDRNDPKDSRHGKADVAVAAANPAMQTPDQVAWQLFAEVTAPAQGGTLPVFETWASDADTFASTGPVWPTGNEATNGLDLRPSLLPTLSTAGRGGAARAVHAQALASKAKPAAAPATSPLGDAASGNSAAAAATPAAKPAATPAAKPAAAASLPYGTSAAEPGSIPPNGPAEEVRRNLPAFTYIKDNHLNSIKGLQAAFQAVSQGGAPLSFTPDSIEVKTNWIPVSAVPQYFPNLQGPVEQNFFVTNDVNGVPHALLSMHLISKQVPNWTWATFEHQANPGRCDWVGCHDKFGATVADVAPADNQGQSPGTVYGACAKTQALQNLLSGANVAAVFGNYCLKGSQTDFNDNTGRAIRLGNSVIEFGFVQNSSCMTCHGTAGFTAQGQPANPNVNADIGAIPASYYWSGAGMPGANYPPALPPYLYETGITPIAVSADFVWSIPFCAYDDTGPTPQPSSCTGGR